MADRDRVQMREFYDELGEAEWERLMGSPRARVSYVVHQRFLDRFINAGDQVLEVGAGPGRFTIELASMGAAIDVTDISPVQLELNRVHLGGTPSEAAVRSRAVLDICNTAHLPSDSYDAVVAYGGPLSYAFEQTADALSGLVRILKPQGVIVASVMSLFGSWRYFLGAVVEDTKRAGEDANDLVLSTGDLRHFGTEHICKMFRSDEIAELVAACGGTLLAMSANNWASLADPEVIAAIESDPDRWSRFLDHEVRVCSQPGALDGGTHLLFAARRN